MSKGRTSVERKDDMKDSEENKKNTLKTEFIFQMGFIVFVLLGAFMKEISWVFWIFACICALCWVVFVQKEKVKEEKEKKAEKEAP
jgi:phosphotransferase system  glucose/maltose/N-acetylglucosamine-specific IIC component